MKELHDKTMFQFLAREGTAMEKAMQEAMARFQSMPKPDLQVELEKWRKKKRFDSKGNELKPVITWFERDAQGSGQPSCVNVTEPTAEEIERLTESFMEALGNLGERKTDLVLRQPIGPNTDATTGKRYCDIGPKHEKEVLAMLSRKFLTLYCPCPTFAKPAMREYYTERPDAREAAEYRIVTDGHMVDEHYSVHRDCLLEQNAAKEYIEKKE